MTQPQYKRPPITEAVIGIDFSSSIAPEDIDSATKKLSANYPQHQTISNLNVALANLNADPSGETTANVNRENGHRIATPDMTQMIVLWKSSFLISQLAPYQGWDSFFERFERDWTIWKRAIGFRAIRRVGMRYINRIDIPVTGTTIEHEKYLNIHPKVPDSLGALSAYAVQAVFPIAEIGCQLVINSAAVPSPIINYASFLVDLDISIETNPPQSEQDIFILLNEMRLRKNAIFESCIRDSARELFK